MLGSECNLRNWVRNLGTLPLKIWGSKHENLGPSLGQLSDLTAIYFRIEQDVMNCKSALNTADTPVGGYVILCTLVY